VNEVAIPEVGITNVNNAHPVSAVIIPTFVEAETIAVVSRVAKAAAVYPVDELKQNGKVYAVAVPDPGLPAVVIG
jgi:hypothetical protein